MVFVSWYYIKYKYFICICYIFILNSAYQLNSFYNINNPGWPSQTLNSCFIFQNEWLLSCMIKITHQLLWEGPVSSVPTHCKGACSALMSMEAQKFIPLDLYLLFFVSFHPCFLNRRLGLVLWIIPVGLLKLQCSWKSPGMLMKITDSWIPFLNHTEAGLGLRNLHFNRHSGRLVVWNQTLRKEILS